MEYVPDSLPLIDLFLPPLKSEKLSSDFTVNAKLNRTLQCHILYHVLVLILSSRLDDKLEDQKLNFIILYSQNGIAQDELRYP